MHLAPTYTADHEQFRTTVRRFIDKEIAPHHAQWEKDGIVSRDLWRKAGAAGLLLTFLPAWNGLPLAAYAAIALWLFAGIALWGLHMGLTQGLFAAYIADLAPGALRGTAFGVFNLATGVVLLATSALSGFVWDVFSPATTFWMGAALAMVGAAALFALPKGHAT